MKNGDYLWQLKVTEYALHCHENMTYEHLFAYKQFSELIRIIKEVKPTNKN